MTDTSASSIPPETSAASWDGLTRPTPEWFSRCPLGIFIHWGPYSVPAWAEPTGELGAVDDTTWFAHNPYSEWYFNTSRIPGSPAQQHHHQVHGDADYDDFLDTWQAEHFDASKLMAELAAAGADYVIPTTKHHDGVTLWDAPGTGERNTVHRGPRRDLVAEIAAAARDQGLRLGLYYSGGLDWHARPGPAHRSARSVHDTDRPKDSGYAEYVYTHVKDLVDRFGPDILWNDMDWPDAGKHFGAHGLGRLLQHFYQARPEGLINDRWGSGTHHDYRTSEYQAGDQGEDGGPWEHCRGLGLSFGYNQVEGPEHYLDGSGLTRHVADVVSRGGHVLLNIGPRADGTLPPPQREALGQLGQWMQVAKEHLVAAAPRKDALTADGEGWVRAVHSGGRPVLFVDHRDSAGATVRVMGLSAEEVSRASEPTRLTWGTATPGPDGALDVELHTDRPGPAVLVL